MRSLHAAPRIERDDHGLVMKAAHVDYTDLTEFGEIHVRYDPARGVVIEVKGFEDPRSGSCRQHCTKAMAWARDVLDVAVRADLLVPGGGIVSVDAGPLDEAG